MNRGGWITGVYFVSGPGSRPPHTTFRAVMAVMAGNCTIGHIVMTGPDGFSLLFLNCTPRGTKVHSGTPGAGGSGYIESSAYTKEKKISLNYRGKLKKFAVVVLAPPL